MRGSPENIQVLHVDDEPDFSEMAAEFLKRQDDRFDVETVTSANDALDWLAENTVDCVVSDFDMPGRNGIEFLEAVREDYRDLPFILYTGKGSEEVASEAISAGVTDYLQKESGTSQYEVLAKRIENAVERQRAQETAAESEQRLQTIAENTNDILWKFTADWNELLFINSPYEEIWGGSIDELRNEPQSFVNGIHPDDRAAVKDAMGRLSAGESVDIEYRVNAEEDYGRWVWVQGEPVMDETGEVAKVVGFVRDITARREREQELAEQQADLRLFEQAVEGSTDLIGAVDTEYNFIFANERHRKFHGFKEDDIVGQPAAEVIGDEWESEVKPRVDRALAGEVVQFDMERTGGDGEVRSFDIQFYPIPGEDGTIGVVGAMRDITERKKREEEIQDRNRQFQGVLDSVQAAIWIRDLDSQFLLANQNFRELFGVADDTAIVGKRPSELFAEEIAAQFRDNDQQVIGTEEQVEIQEEVETERGLRTYLTRITPLFDDDDKLFATCGVASEITEQKEREQEISRLNQLHQAVLSNIRETVLVTNDDGQFTYICPNVEFLFGYDDEEVAEIGTVEALFGERLIDADTLETAGELTNIETKVTDSSGNELDVVVTVRQVDIEEGTRLYSVRDISALKERERELQRQNERLGEFASVISHDLRNPLRVAEGNLQLALEDGGTEPLEGVAQALDRMDELIDDMLTLANAGELVGATERVELAALAEASWRNVETGSAAVDIDADNYIRADETRLQQLLENLFRNAVEHGGEGVTITVSNLPDGFYVEDDGPGIPPEERDNVLDPGYSTQEDGTGFGLNIVRDIAKAHGWTIEVSSGTNGGARIEINDVELD